MAKLPYKRILLKVSGEVLAGDQSFGIEPKFLNAMAAQIVAAAQSGIQIGIVIGAGNIFRGMAVAAEGTDRVTADLMGMLGTVINSLALSNAIMRGGAKAKVFSALTMPSVADSFTARAAKAALAVEETRYHHALVNAERLAAIGQTVTALSQDLKNILQGLEIGGERLRVEMQFPLLIEAGDA